MSTCQRECYDGGLVNASSRSRSILSRTVSLPFPCCFSMATSPPHPFASSLERSNLLISFPHGPSIATGSNDCAAGGGIANGDRRGGTEPLDHSSSLETRSWLSFLSVGLSQTPQGAGDRCRVSLEMRRLHDGSILIRLIVEYKTNKHCCQAN